MALVLYLGTAGVSICSSSKVSNKFIPAMPCGIYGALSEAGWGVSGMTSASGSAVVTLGEVTSLGFILGVTLGDGTWLGITL
jgi:hypothetical protein